VSYVVAATQDRDGFIWVAGPGGLSRFDGSEFTTVYRNSSTLISGCVATGRVVFWNGKGLAEVVGDGIVDLDVPGNPALKPIGELQPPTIDPASLNGPEVTDLMTQAGLL